MSTMDQPQNTAHDAQAIAQIFSLFPDFDANQRRQIEALGHIYREWNERINVVSRRDIDNLYPAHVLHSLAIARFWGPLAPDTTVMDLGTGGGFPGIPLAIAYPDVKFHLVDRIAKKLTVAKAVAEYIGLSNVTFQHGDSGECRSRFDYVVSRAVMPLNQLVKASRHLIVAHGKNTNRYAPGLVCLKGGDLADESQGIGLPIHEYPLGEIYGADIFPDKKLVYVPLGRK